MGMWGGGGGGFGPPPGRPGGGSFGAQPGLPFAGIPPEIAAKVEKLVENEPEHPEWDKPFEQVAKQADGFTLLRFLRPHWAALLVAFVLVAFDAVLAQLGPMLTEHGIDHGILRGDKAVVYRVGALFIGTIFLHAIANYFRLSFTGKFGQTLMHDLRIQVFSHIQRLSMDYFTDEKAGRIMTRMTSDIEALQQLFTDGLVNLLVQGITLVFIVAILFSRDVELTLILLASVIPVMLALTVWFTVASDRAFLAIRDRIADVLADLQETLSGIRILSMYNRQRHNTIRHFNVVGRYLGANKTGARVSGAYGPAADMIGVASQGLVLLVGGRMVLRGDLSPGTFILFFQYLGRFFAPIQQLVSLHTIYQQGKAAITKIDELFATKPSVTQKPGAEVLPPILGEITFDGVTFGYDPARPVLAHVDLTIAAGETFALVGPTGAGKSTIAKLVTRFYDPTAGSVLVDGHDIRDVTFESLRTQLGVVPQESFLFAGSIRDNIAFARPEATTDEILEACQAVGIGDLIDRLPEGLDTPCHERGVTLSSGERQLIALARAFLAQPRVLILDEATSNLDLATEGKIEQALDRLLEGRTAILIAHRLNTAMRADRIAVIDEGHIVELGSPEELARQGGRFAEMLTVWASQGQGSNGTGNGSTSRTRPRKAATQPAAGKVTKATTKTAAKTAAKTATNTTRAAPAKATRAAAKASNAETAGARRRGASTGK